MHLEEFFNKLYKNKVKTNLKVIQDVLKQLGFSKSFKIINIVGTNGKGSVCTYLSDAFVDNGISIGLFTSPHITSFNERIKVNNQLIDTQEFIEIAKRVEKHALANKMNWFSTIYVIAMLYFQSKNVDYVILEAGIGGQLDSTNAIDGDFGAVTSISTDHLDFLISRDNIPKDKSGIINEGMKFFVPSVMAKEDRKPFIEKGATVVSIAKGTYQDENKQLASIIFKEIADKEIKVFNTPLGRTSVLKHNGVDVIIDVGHNEDAINRTVQFINENNLKYEQVLISLSKDKDTKTIAKHFKEPFIWINNGPKPKEFEQYSIDGILVNDLKEFISKIDKPTLFIGSFYLAEEVFKWIKH